jgi:hypothetical protein
MFLISRQAEVLANDARAALERAGRLIAVEGAASVDGFRALVEARFGFTSAQRVPWALAAPALAWLLLVGGGGLRRRLRQRAASGPLRALRDAESRLQAAQAAAGRDDAREFHANAESSVLAVLEAKLGEGIRGLTRGQLRALLRQRGMSAELIAQTVELLERSEFARFGSGAGGSAGLRDQAGALQQLFRRLSSFQPRLEEDAA